MALYGIEVRYRPPRTPHWGGHIERLIGTMMGAVRLLPGATGANVAERGDDPEATAAVTLDELETWLAHQIAGIYHHTVHRSIGKTPIAAWNEAVQALPHPLRHPQDHERFYLDFLPFKRRTIQRDGVSLFNITYSDGVLATFKPRPREKFLVRYDPQDLSTVYLRDHDGHYWAIPYSDRRLPPVTLAEVKAASRRLSTRAEKSITQRELFASIEQQRTLIEQAVVQTKRLRREQERTIRALSGRTQAREVGRSAEAPVDGEEEGGPVLPYPVEEWPA